VGLNDLRKFASAFGGKRIGQFCYPFIVVHANKLTVVDRPAIGMQVGRESLASEVLGRLKYDVVSSHRKAGFWKHDFRLLVLLFFFIFFLVDWCQVAFSQFVMLIFLFIPAPCFVEPVVSEEPRIVVGCF
jgi:hypothetical protein